MSRRTYAGVSAADRQAQRRRQLLDAAAELVRTDGFPAVTYRAVCRTARLTERYFYESFANVDELLVALADEHLPRVAGQVTAAIAQAEDSPQGAVRAAITSFTNQVAEDRLVSALLLETSSNGALRAVRQTAIEMFIELMMQTGEAVLGSATTARDARRGRHLAIALVGGFNELLLYWLDGKYVTAGRQEIIDDATELFFAVAERLVGDGTRGEGDSARAAQ